MFEFECPKDDCKEMAVVTTTDLERNDVLTCDKCETVILIIDDECRKQLGLSLKDTPNIWLDLKEKSILPPLNKINIILFIDDRFEEYSNNGDSDSEIYIINSLTQPHPDFKTVIQRFDSRVMEMKEQYFCDTGVYLFWNDCYFPSLSSPRNDTTDLIQKSCMAMVQNDTLKEKEFKKLYKQFVTEQEKLL